MKKFDDSGIPIEDTFHNLMSKSEKVKANKSKLKSNDATSSCAYRLEAHLSTEIGEIFCTLHTDVITSDDMQKYTIRFPTKIKDLPINTIVGISLFDINSSEENSLVGSSCFYLFDSKRRLRQGVFNLYLHFSKQCDFSCAFTTPGFPADNEPCSSINKILSKIGDKEPVVKQTPEAIKRALLDLYTSAKHVYIEISMPIFDLPVIHDESKVSTVYKDILYPSYLMVQYKNTFMTPGNGVIKNVLDKPMKEGKISLKNTGVVRYHDFSVMGKQNLQASAEGERNPVSDLYYFLTRTEDDMNAEKLTPDTEDHSALLETIETPDFTSLKPDQKNLLWKFRYSIKNDERYSKGIVKFLKSVNWDSSKESNEAMEMMKDWKFGHEQALSMLSDMFSANDLYSQGIAKEKSKYIRINAIKCLDKCDIDTIEMILLELAQAYRYEDYHKSFLKKFFLQKAVQNSSIAQKFYWIVKLEKDNKNNLQEIRDQYGMLCDEFMTSLENVNSECKTSLDRQLAFRNKLLDLSSYIKAFNKVSLKKSKLREVIDLGGEFEMLKFENTPMPLDPEVQVCGVVPEK